MRKYTATLHNVDHIMEWPEGEQEQILFDYLETGMKPVSFMHGPEQAMGYFLYCFISDLRPESLDWRKEQIPAAFKAAAEMKVSND
jgi:hypothetical protein